MAFDFPASPTMNQEFTPAGGPTYVWNGYGWGMKAPTNLVRADATSFLSIGYTNGSYSMGSISSGSLTPNVANGHFQYYTNNGAHTLAPPTVVPGSAFTMIVDMTNSATPGALSLPAWTKVDGDSIPATANAVFRFYMSVVGTAGGTVAHLNAKRLV